MKGQQAYYDEVWSRQHMLRKQPDIGWTYEKRRIDTTLLSLLKDLRDSSARILEIGIGKGDLVSKVCPRNKLLSYIGIDISSEGVKIARRKVPNFDFLVADGVHLPFKSQQFDKVVCSEVIEHITRKDELLLEISRVLKEGGILLMTTPNPKALSYILPRMISKVKRFHYGSNQPVNELIEREELTKLLQSHGFEILSHTGLILRPYTVSVAEHFLKRPITLIRWFSEYAERKNLLSGLGLYQIVVARNKGTLSVMS